jgi:ATP-dependent exoDNAse (exonuclease V) beta subunit
VSSTAQKPLKVLNASAGSGKTYNLVKEYVLLLLSDEKDLSRFSKIIAMTFTNKAALEMKTRIVKALDELSYPDIHKKKSDQYAQEIAKELVINPEEVHIRAQKVLQNILHRYEDFFVMTIDKFNLKLIRSFSRDLDLPNDFDVILNESEVIEQVVDLLLNQLGKKDLENLTALVFEYAKDNLDEGERWNFRDQLIEFSKVLSKEKEQPVINRLMVMDFSITRRRELVETLKDQVDDFLTRCRSVFDLYQRYNIPSDLFPGKSITTKAIEKLGQLDIIPSGLLSDAFITKASEEPPKGREFPQDLRSALIELQGYYDQIAPIYFVGKAFLKNFYNMALLQYLARSLHTVKKEEQLIRISEFNTLISNLVRNEEAPFIYERLGSRFHNFLLDEFQDTSRLQWLNMVPLVHESISNLNKNLIVGDPKQSIYRFKNGVAEQFVALPKIYNPENDALITERSIYFDEMGQVRSLEDNWRSSPLIVQFNNALFPHIKDKLPAISKDFYNSIHQNARSTSPGLVDIVSSEGKMEDIDLVPMIVNKIEECERDGFKRGDICILSDMNFRANIWAVELTRLGYKVVSSESLLVQNEVKVKLVISYLKRRLNPSSSSEKKRFSEIYFRINKEDAFTKYRTYFERRIDADGKEYSFFNDDKFIVDHFGNAADFFCKYENLYDLIQSFYSMMKWDELKNPYLHHLADFAHDFELSKGPDLRSFLDHYAEQQSKLAIQMPDSDDAIKIMTIHKSKGLEFPVVILPFMNFDLSIKNGSRFLIEVNDYILYTTLSKTSPIGEVRSLNEFEHAQILTDKVNQCYVGFTRPIERLYVFNFFDKKHFGSILHDCLSKLPQTVQVGAALKIELGVATRHNPEGHIKESAFFVPVNNAETLWFPDISLQDDPELGRKNLLSDEQRFGNQFHLAMAAIDHPDEIEQKLDSLVRTGDVEESFRIRIHEKISSLFADTSFRSLFENAEEILNEQSIILDEKNTRRPDKLILKNDQTIVIDYKTGLPSSKYERQMTEYIQTLKQMDLPNVKGYLLYTVNNELREIL